ncbi:hypothetical protein, partial [Methylobacter sp.]|uniref:hypothetical protein n=1 Tax=Methylobacter sp. TaxID=2051955 RepID=UPI002489135E
MRKILLIFFFYLIAQSSVFADSYSGIAKDGYYIGANSKYYSGQEACTSYVPGSTYSGSACTNVPGYSSTYSVPVSVIVGYYRYELTCPGGGTLSGSTCTNAPACLLAQTRVNGVCKSPICVAPQFNDAITGACISPPDPVCKIAETLVDHVCVSPGCVAPAFNDAITGACITPPPPADPTCKIAETLINHECVQPGCVYPAFNDVITGACITPAQPPVPPESNLPSCSSLICASVDQPCKTGDGSTGVVSACPSGGTGGDTTGGGTTGGDTTGGGTT